MRHQFAPVLNRFARAAYVFGVSFLLVGIVLSYLTQPAEAADNQGETKRCEAVKIDVCHHTSSASNPYEIISVNINSVDDGLTAGGHLTHSKVPFVLFESDAWDSFEYCGVTFPAFGDQDLVANHCVYVSPTPPTETQTQTQTETLTTTFTPPTETLTQTITETETQTQSETITTTYTPPTETLTQTQTETLTVTITETLIETSTQTLTQTLTETPTETLTETITQTQPTEIPTDTPVTETQGPPTITAMDPIQTQTEEQTLPPPPANITPVVLIPVTGVIVIQPAAINYSMTAIQNIFLNVGMILLGFGLAFHSLAKKFID